MRTNRPGRHLAAALLLPAMALAAEGVTRGPVPLFAPGPETPMETAGTGAAPTVDVKMILDERGRPEAVEILDVRPASSQDDRFIRAARETLLNWRFAPALDAGQPTGSTQVFSLQFLGLEEQSGGAEAQGVIQARQAALTFRQRTLALPREQRVEIQKARAKEALDFMRLGRIRMTQSSRFNVFCDADSPDVARAVARNLEVGFNFMRDIVGHRVPPQPDADRVMALVYSLQRAYRAMRDELTAFEFSATGFYDPAGLLFFQTQMSNDEQLLEVMLHEGVHAYVDRYVARPGVVFPRWLDEGLAQYVENSKIGANNKLVAGKIRKRQTLRTWYGNYRIKSNARYNLEETRTAIKKGAAISVREMVHSTREEFYGERVELYYTMSWLLIHYLRHGQPEWAERHFPDLVLYVAEGYAPADVFRAIYGDPDAFQDGFVRYVKKF